MSESGLLSESGESGSSSDVGSYTDNSERWSQSEDSDSESGEGGRESEGEYLPVTGLGVVRDESEWQYCEQQRAHPPGGSAGQGQWQRQTAGAMYRY